MSNATRHSIQSIPLAQSPKPFNMRTSEACLSCINCLIWELVRHGWAWLHQSCRPNCLNGVIWQLKLAISRSGSIGMSNSAEPFQSDQILAWEPDHMLLVRIVSPIDKHNYLFSELWHPLQSPKARVDLKLLPSLGNLLSRCLGVGNTNLYSGKRLMIGRIPAV